MLVLFEGQDTMGIILLIVGAGLIILEMFLPGFGLPGISGGICLFFGVLLFARTISEALLMILIIGVMLTLLFFLLVKSVAKGRLSRSPIILNDAATADGSYDASLDRALIGQVGTTLSQLRPSGIAQFDELRLDVVSNGDFIAAGVSVRIASIQGRQVLVVPVPSTPEESKGV